MNTVFYPHVEFGFHFHASNYNCNLYIDNRFPLNNMYLGISWSSCTKP